MSIIFLLRVFNRSDWFGCIINNAIGRLRLQFQTIRCTKNDNSSI